MAISQCDAMMIRIEYIRVRLPDSMHPQAAQLPKNLADALARLSFSQTVAIKSLSIPPLTIEHGHNINNVAKQMANAIHRQIEGGNT